MGIYIHLTSQTGDIVRFCNKTFHTYVLSGRKYSWSCRRILTMEQEIVYCIAYFLQSYSGLPSMARVYGVTLNVYILQIWNSVVVCVCVCYDFNISITFQGCLVNMLHPPNNYFCRDFTWIGIKVQDNIFVCSPANLYPSIDIGNVSPRHESCAALTSEEKSIKYLFLECAKSHTFYCSEAAVLTSTGDINVCLITVVSFINKIDSCLNKTPVKFRNVSNWR